MATKKNWVAKFIAEEAKREARALPVHVGDNEYTIYLRSAVTPAELVSFATNCIDGATVEDPVTHAEKYHDALFPYSFRLNFLNTVAGLRLTGNEKNIELLVFGEGCLYEQVTAAMDSDLLAVLNETADRYRAEKLHDVREEKNPMTTFLYAITDLLESYSESTKNLDMGVLTDIASKLGKVDETKVADAFVRELRESQENEAEAHGDMAGDTGETS